MKALKPFACVSVLLISLSAYCAEEAQVSIIERQVVRDSSEHNRMKMSNSIVAQLAGVGPTPGSQSGLVFAHFIKPDELIQIEATGGENKWGGSSSDYRAKGSTIGVFFKKFSGNSFYVKGGLDYATLDYRYMYDYSGGVVEGYSFQGNKLSGSVSIGNQWQFENFTIGCDWIGWSVPVTYSVYDEQIYGNSPYSKGDIQDSKELYLQNSYPLALHFYMGASF